MAACATCSTEVDPGTYCPMCGQYFEATAPAASSMPPPPPPPPPPSAGQPYGGQTYPGQPYGVPAYGAVPPDVGSKKLAAGICGILLGALGVHKFVLGYTSAGLIMLLCTLLTCGIAGVVFGVIGLVEGIIYLTKSDDDFYRTYIAQQKQWF
jgi:TM2 domain-containing membrane protein YozV